MLGMHHSGREPSILNISQEEEGCLAASYIIINYRIGEREGGGGGL